MRELAPVNIQLLASTLERFIADELAAASLSGYVVGLSGGIDSAVATALAVRAVGAGAVTALALPGPTSSSDSLDDARAIAASIGLTLELIDLSIPGRAMAEALAVGDDKLRLGNAMARLRMVALFDRARSIPGLVLGTSNKSEILLGYSTLFGDSAASVQPLGDVWKTHVYALGEHVGLRGRILTKAPTADLWVGQTDAEELGFEYREADPVLEAHHGRGLDREALVAAGFSARLVDAVLLAYRRNRFKWRPTVVARVSASAINIDRILPRNPER